MQIIPVKQHLIREDHLFIVLLESSTMVSNSTSFLNFNYASK